MPSISQDWFGKTYWTEDSSLIRKIYVIGKGILIAGIAAGLCLYNPPLFAPCFFIGIFLRTPLDYAFHNVARIFEYAPILSCLILGVGAILTWPSSGWLACGLVALWAGKRVTDLALSTYYYPPSLG